MMKLRLQQQGDTDGVLSSIKALLSVRFGIDHATVQIEYGQCTDGNREPSPTVGLTGLARTGGATANSAAATLMKTTPRGDPIT